MKFSCFLQLLRWEDECFRPVSRGHIYPLALMASMERSFHYCPIDWNRPNSSSWPPNPNRHSHCLFSCPTQHNRDRRDTGARCTLPSLNPPRQLASAVLVTVQVDLVKMGLQSSTGCRAAVGVIRSSQPSHLTHSIIDPIFGPILRNGC